MGSWYIHSMMGRDDSTSFDTESTSLQVRAYVRGSQVLAAREAHGVAATLSKPRVLESAVTARSHPQVSVRSGASCGEESGTSAIAL